MDRKAFYTLRVCRSDAKLIGKRAAAAKKADPKAAEGAGPSTGGRPKRQRKQVEKD